jgi:hypothetical protein
MKYFNCYKNNDFVSSNDKETAEENPNGKRNFMLCGAESI